MRAMQQLGDVRPTLSGSSGCVRVRPGCQTAPDVLFSERMTDHLKRQTLAVFLAAIGVVAISASGVPHHGTNISYDRTKPVTLKGTVTEFRLANPHPQLYVDVKDDGTPTRWAAGKGTP